MGIMEALQQHLGGGPPPGPVGGGLPPALMSAIAGASPASEDTQGHEQNEVELLTKILDDMTSFMKVAADEDDKATIATCIASIQKLRAKDQAEQDGAMKGQASPRLMRKTASAVGGGLGGPSY